MPPGSWSVDEGCRGPGHDDLAAVPGRRDPGGSIDLEAAVVVTGQVRLARVQAHPDPQAAVDRPWMTLDRALRRDRREHGGAGLGEGSEQGIALGPDDDATAAPRPRDG